MIVLDISKQGFLSFRARAESRRRCVALHEEIVLWLTENASEWKLISHYTTEPGMEYWISFSREAELSAFKLRWWGARP